MSKITQSARQEECTIRSPWCNFDRDTTVWCHAPSGLEFGRGANVKSHDAIGCYGCSQCHDTIDGRAHIHETTFEQRRSMFLRGFCASFEMLIEKGLVVIP